MNLARWMLCAFMAAALSGCGSSDSSGGTGGTGVTAGVVTAYGSIVVNGVHYDETGAAVVINDAVGSGAHRGIKIGMTVKIRGTNNGFTGVASDIEAEHAVEGKVASTNGADTLVVLGQTVMADAQTLYEPSGTTFANLAVNTQVEVYGLRDQNNVLRATLIEVVDNALFAEELRGVISSLNTVASTFEINGHVIHYDNTTIFDDGGSIGALVNGLTVEVHFNTSVSGNHATVIEFEDNEDSAYALGDGSEFEIEGYIASIVDASTFIIDGKVVQTTPLTAYENGIASDIAVGRKIHIKGRASSGQLVVSRISFE